MQQEFIWVFTIMSLVGAYFNSKGDLLTSHCVWVAANVAWCIIDLCNGIYPQATLYACFIALNINGIRTAMKMSPKDPSDYEEFDY